MLVRVSNANVKANRFYHHKKCTTVHDDFHLHHHLHHLHHLHHHVHNDFQPFPCSTLAHQLNLSRPWAFPLCARHGHHHHHRHHHRCHHRHHHYHGQGHCLYVPDSIEEAEPIDNFPKTKVELGFRSLNHLVTHCRANISPPNTSAWSKSWIFPNFSF